MVLEDVDDPGEEYTARFIASGQIKNGDNSVSSPDKSDDKNSGGSSEFYEDHNHYYEYDESHEDGKGQLSVRSALYLLNMWWTIT